MTVNQAKNFKTINIRDFLNDEGVNSFSIVPMLRVLWLYKWALLISFIVGAGIGLHISTKQTPLYRSSLSMLVQPQFANSAQVGQGYLDERSYRYYETQYRIIRSRAVLDRVVGKLNLLDNTIYQYPASRNLFAAFLDKVAPGFNYSTDEAPDYVQLKFASVDAAVANINSHLQLLSSDQTELLELRFSAPDPKFSADVVNAIAQSYKDYLEETKTNRVTQASSWLMEQLTEIKQELKTAEQALQQFRAREGTFNTKNLEISTEKSLSELKEALTAAQLHYKQLLQRYGPKHPKLLDAKAQVEIAQSELDNGSTQAVKKRGTEFELVRLEGNVDSARNLYSMFLQRFQEANMSTDVSLSDATIVDYAKQPKNPYNMTGSKTIILSAMLGLLLCGGFITLRFHFDNTFKSHYQVEKRLGVSVLSVLPNVAKLQKVMNRMQPLYRKKHSAIYTENINRIRSALQYADEGQAAKVIQLTSSVEGEGKSTLSFNLAIACAHLGKKTLIIDADMRRPQLQRVIKKNEGDNGKGLSDWWQGGISLAEAIKDCKYDPDLQVMPSGSRTASPLELLSSEAFDRLIVTLREHYDHVIIDSPPILPVADGLEIGRRVDGVIMVIEAEKTQSTVVKQAIAQMDEADIVPFGAVLSKLTETASEYYYPRRYYGYYYGESNS